MSFDTWHNNGYGFRTDNLKIRDMKSLQDLMDLCSNYKARMEQDFEDADIINPSIEDYLAYDEDMGCCGIAKFLAEAINEQEHIRLLVCDDFDGNVFLLYMPFYPWTPLTKEERNITQEELDDIFYRYVNIVSDDIPDIGEQEVGNGG